MRHRLNPQRDQGNLVHESPHRSIHPIIVPVTILPIPPFLPLLPFPPVLTAGKQLRRVVLDAQDVAIVEALATDERIGPRVEFESQEVRRVDEVRLPALEDQPFDVALLRFLSTL